MLKRKDCSRRLLQKSSNLCIMAFIWREMVYKNYFEIGYERLRKVLYDNNCDCRGS